MIWERFSPDGFVRSDWSGGSTTELLIEPAGEDFAKRKFRYRISSASFKDTASTYSDFSGYERIILPLQGWLTVTHRKDDALLYARRLSPYEADYFFGSWHTDSTNSPDCLDFNIITREGIWTELSIVREKERLPLKHEGHGILFSRSDYKIRFPQIGEASEGKKGEATEEFIPGGTLVRLMLDEKTSFMDVAPEGEPVIFCEIGKDMDGNLNGTF